MSKELKRPNSASGSVVPLPKRIGKGFYRLLRQIWGFLREAKAELKKVTWPGKQQIWYSTIIVIAFTLCVSLYLGVLDLLLRFFFRTILS
jgi:preprotein translocase subunit SecE